MVMSSSPNCYSASMGGVYKGDFYKEWTKCQLTKTLMSSSPNPYSASKAVFTQATLTRNEQNTNERKCYVTFSGALFSFQKGVYISNFKKDWTKC
jgi:hypothetical protein